MCGGNGKVWEHLDRVTCPQCDGYGDGEPWRGVWAIKVPKEVEQMDREPVGDEDADLWEEDRAEENATASPLPGTRIVRVEPISDIGVRLVYGPDDGPPF